MLDIITERLRLISLAAPQLQQYLDDPAGLEQELQIALSRAVITETVRRAITIKLGKMAAAREIDHPWYTYWLIVIRESSFGAGLAGFKGLPDAAGEVEIGYGIDPICQGKGYMTEAARALIDWAFQSPDCHIVIAPKTLKTNPASNRVLEKAGMVVYEETETTRSWRIVKP